MVACGAGSTIGCRLQVSGCRLLRATPFFQGERHGNLSGISMDPAIRFGKPCIVGRRVDVATVIGALGAGESYESVEQNYSLTREQILTALRYAAHVAAHQPPAVKLP
jgi:uncharacterized protein (DUF433 family)